VGRGANRDVEKTTIAGTIKHEVVCTPLPNAEADLFLRSRAEEAAKPPKEITVLDRLPPNGVGAGEWENFFVRALVPCFAVFWLINSAENQR
jgi:hypothetical protein